MTATNHVVTGSLITAIVTVPIIGLPLAFASHYLLDAFPHFGKMAWSQHHVSPKFTTALSLDILLASLFLISLLIFRPENWPLYIAGGVLAASSDLMWLPSFIRSFKKAMQKPHNKIMTFHHMIQWERPWGFFVEIIWLVVTLAAFITIVNP